MAIWAVYLSLCLLVALNASVETRSLGNKRCGACRPGWSAFGCRCFRVFNSHYTWAGAEKFCLIYDGNLASIHSHEEYMFIQNLIRDTTHSTKPAWIGGHDAVEEGVWLWSDGSKMNYQIWSPGEPNNHAYEHCLEINDATDGNWNDMKCSARRLFVCALNQLVKKPM